MKKVSAELKGVNVAVVAAAYGVEVEAFNSGSGIYCIQLGSRGKVEGVDLTDQYLEENELEYFDEDFYSVVGVDDFQGFDTFGVSYYEDFGVEFVNVKI